MGIETTEAAALWLAWFRDMGVDAALSEAGTDWLQHGERPPGADALAKLAAPGAGPGRSGAAAPLSRPAPSIQSAPPVQPSSGAPPRPLPSRPAMAPPAPVVPARAASATGDAATSAARALAAKADTIEALAAAIAGFDGCALKATATNTCVYRGAPKARLMLIGEAPGRDEDLQGVPFVGRSGQLLDRLLAEEVGLGRHQVYIANVVKCRPPDNRDPRPEEITACRPYLEEQVSLIAPKVVVTLGNFATRLLLDTDQGITKLRGAAYPVGDVQLVPTFHPAAALRGGGVVLAQMRADLVRAKQLIGLSS